MWINVHHPVQKEYAIFTRIIISSSSKKKNYTNLHIFLHSDEIHLEGNNKNEHKKKSIHTPYSIPGENLSRTETLYGYYRIIRRRILYHFFFRLCPYTLCVHIKSRFPSDFYFLIKISLYMRKYKKWSKKKNRYYVYRKHFIKKK